MPAARRSGSASRSPTSSPACSRSRGSRWRSSRATRIGRGPARRHRHARLHGGAADLSGGQLLRDWPSPASAWATGIRRSSRTRRSPRATASFVVAVGNDCAVARVLPRVRPGGARRRPAVRDEPPACGRLRRARCRSIAERLRTRTRAEWIEALNAAGVPCGAGARRRRGAAGSAARSAADDRASRARDPRRRARSSAFRSSCPTRPAACAARRRRSGSTRSRSCGTTWGSRPRTSRRCDRPARSEAERRQRSTSVPIPATRNSRTSSSVSSPTASRRAPDVRT